MERTFSKSTKSGKKSDEQSLDRLRSSVVTKCKRGRKHSGSGCKKEDSVKSEPLTLCTKKVCEDSIIKKRLKCYDQPKPKEVDPCVKVYTWQHGKYLRDDCGSGIVPNKMDFRRNHKFWCKTPLSMYQATIGELGRQLLCGETRITKDIRNGPPCNICEYVLPLCRGYYRKYDCIKPCEAEYAKVVNGKVLFRDPVERYWQPCLTPEEKKKENIKAYAPHNAYLGDKLRRAFNAENPCW